MKSTDSKDLNVCRSEAFVGRTAVRQLEKNIVKQKTVYEVFLENPISVNHQFFTKTVKSKKTGQMVPIRIPTSQAKDFKEYAGWKFKEAGIPAFDGKKKVVFEVWGVWPNKRKRDLSNMSKPVLDAFKECGHVPDDCICLWREQDYRTEPGVYGLKLKIYESELTA